MPIKPTSARAAALLLLTEVTENGRLFAELLPHALEKLSPSDRARAQRLATTTLRWADRADRMLGPYLRNRPEDSVLNALRLGVVEMAVLKAEAHGVVGEMVGVVKAAVSLSKSKLVNAVLRNITGDLEKWDELPVPQFPKWLRRSFRDSWGNEVMRAIEAAHIVEPALDLTIKSGGPEDWAQKLGGRVLPIGSVRLTSAGQISRLPGYESGEWWVQDAAATLPALILAAKPGENILDLCAAPGGKTMQLTAKGATVTAVDDSEHRLLRMTENMKRTGLPASVVVADVLKWQPDELFDAILLDAPCSATGTIRRHPDLPYAKTMDDIAPLLPIQSAMLDRAIEWLKPGGRLVYCTCSLLPAEGEEQIKALLMRNPNARVMRHDDSVPGVEQTWVGEFGLRTRPDFWAEHGGMDGFFISKLQKAA